MAPIVRRHGGGFGLLEAVVATFVLSVTLLLGMAFLGVQQRAVAAEPLRFAAHRAVEATFESLRAGDVLLRSGPVRFLTIVPPLDPRLELWMRLEPAGRSGLFSVTVEARWESRYGTQRFAVQSLTFQPALAEAAGGGVNESPAATDQQR